MAKTIFIQTESGPMSIRKLAAVYGVNYMTVYFRWMRGERAPERLTRPPDARYRGGASSVEWLRANATVKS